MRRLNLMPHLENLLRWQPRRVPNINPANLLNFEAFRIVRVNLGYRALGVPVAEGVQWFWIGSHADCDKLLD